ncbi:hypothetical protein PHLGIDRAFT_98171 [Phlebiopsis gigantea 11061_1 CR5-6]|uniref:Small ribosomal subunit protein mS38 n=1 Tax=Phlebiopsis gigantea (strain 11061_1 CR5-6) TaxID=745531 RepID=A0A0C3PWA6_PHLG1|nr:hypothetical protein PHLGIDRAFT_98171 [Phlebiopsis gigantea 11061_1 CR5-6]
MSTFSTFLRPLPAVRRAYSIFTKPGGGRYFNSAKPLQATNKSKVETTSNGEPASNGAVAEEPASTQALSSSPGDLPPSVVTPSLGVNFSPFPFHPAVNSHDLKLHQFFSLHRPLLNIGQPGSSIFDPSSQSFIFPPEARVETAHSGTIDDPPEASPESDADAARQLARALVVNRVGATMHWEDVLQKLGLDETARRAEEVSLAEAEFDVYMDSTKRKRRRKMKKHKLKKRRRLTRMQEANRKK